RLTEVGQEVLCTGLVLEGLRLLSPSHLPAHRVRDGALFLPVLPGPVVGLDAPEPHVVGVHAASSSRRASSHSVKSLRQIRSSPLGSLMLSGALPSSRHR